MSAEQAQPQPLRRERNLILPLLILFGVAAWAVLIFSRVHVRRQERGQAFVPTWVFVAGYLVIWALFGVLAYGVAVGLEALAGQWAWLAENAGRIGGVVLIGAGIYQLTPLKRSCL